MSIYPRKYWGRMALHIPVGVAMSLLVIANPVISALFGIGFLVYEVSENFDEHDKAYPDIAGFLWGIALGAGIVWLLL